MPLDLSDAIVTANTPSQPAGTLLGQGSAAAGQGKPLTINEASKATGLSPSVLRIWELRYGWPTPRRRGNGYRTYPHPLVEDLRRAAQLIRTGTPIGQLIVDGLPRWPADRTRPVPSRALPLARSLPAPSGEPARLQAELIEACEQGRHTEVRAIIQRAPFVLRPSEESAAVLAPALVAIAELKAAERWTAEIDGVVADLAARSAQLARGPAAGWRIVPVTERDIVAARVAVLLLRARGQACQVASSGRDGTGPWLAVSADGFADGAPAGRDLIGTLSVLPGAHPGFAALLARSAPLPWTVPASDQR